MATSERLMVAHASISIRVGLFTETRLSMVIRSSCWITFYATVAHIRVSNVRASPGCQKKSRRIPLAVDERTFHPSIHPSHSPDRVELTRQHATNASVNIYKCRSMRPMPTLPLPFTLSRSGVRVPQRPRTVVRVATLNSSPMSGHLLGHDSVYTRKFGLLVK